MFPNFFSPDPEVIGEMHRVLIPFFLALCVTPSVHSLEGTLLVKSRMMGDSTYKSTLACFIKTLKSEGPLAFYKVFIPNFGRLGSWNVIMFLTLEQVDNLEFLREMRINPIKVAKALVEVFAEMILMNMGARCYASTLIEWRNTRARKLMRGLASSGLYFFS